MGPRSGRGPGISRGCAALRGSAMRRRGARCCASAWGRRGGCGSPGRMRPGGGRPGPRGVPLVWGRGGGGGGWGGVVVGGWGVGGLRCGGEGGRGDWSGVYLRRVLGVAEAMASRCLVVCAGVMVVFRLGGDELVRRLGPVRVVRWG